ncbi:MAG: TetR/AcrR family transcriptional regulator [Rhizobium sp.]|nr:TetR/AcrR family transcriptional regulator [Rhizobium sp.]
MSRQPHARSRILEASRSLIRSGGARSLTLGKLKVAASVTNGGVLYHWPNREALLEALVSQDIDMWIQQSQALRGDRDAVLGHVRSALSADEGIGEVAASLLPELRRYPALQLRIRSRFEGLFHGWHWDEADVYRYALLLAAEGAFWRRLHGMAPVVPQLDARLLALIEERIDG